MEARGPSGARADIDLADPRTCIWCVVTSLDTSAESEVTQVGSSQIERQRQAGALRCFEARPALQAAHQADERHYRDAGPGPQADDRLRRRLRRRVVIGAIPRTTAATMTAVAALWLSPGLRRCRDGYQLDRGLPRELLPAIYGGEGAY